MSLERLSFRFLRVGRHQSKACVKTQRQTNVTVDDESAIRAADTRICCCTTDSPLYSNCWPVIFLVSAITDFPFPLPKGKKPGQHRDWGWVPVLVILSITAFLYYGYLVQVNFLLLRDGHTTQAIVYLVPFHLWCIFYLISYARVVSQRPGHPTKTFKASTIAPQDDKASIQRPDRPHSILAQVQWCDSCKVWKPDRAHHCRVCDACVLRMDHHCPWVNGCVGLKNHRYFMQFICYVSGTAAWIFATTLAAFIMYNKLETFGPVVIAELVVSGCLVVAIGTFTCSHIWLALLNRTTIENNQLQTWQKSEKNGKTKSKAPATFTKSGDNVFFQGAWASWTETMGERWWQWFLPISISKGNDDDEEQYHFGYNPKTLEKLHQEDQSITTTDT